MNEKMRERAIKHGLLYIKRGYTVRSVAAETGVHKNTVHNDLYRLEMIRPELFQKCLEKLKFNLDTRHLRGGESTKKKYKK